MQTTIIVHEPPLQSARRPVRGRSPFRGHVRRAAEVAASYSSAGSVPVTTASYTATGNTVNFTLNFAPVAGSALTVVKNTGMAFIQGTFDNLQQGQKLNLLFGGIIYPFVANYYGGTGNDLVLQWGNTRLLTWGANTAGQLGQDHTSNVLIPAPLPAMGSLTGKAILSVSVGSSHCLALCADGSLVSWGDNYYGQLGDNSLINRSLRWRWINPGCWPESG